MNSRFEETFLLTATEVLRAIAHPIRIGIVDLLSRQEKMAVKEIQESLDIEQAVVSHHLRIMKDKSIVEAARDGKNTFYSLRAQDFQQIVEALEKML